MNFRAELGNYIGTVQAARKACLELYMHTNIILIYDSKIPLFNDANIVESTMPLPF
jgi:hypothetical protein